MKKNYRLRIDRGVVATVLVLAFVRVPYSWGGEPEIFGRNPQTGTDSSRELTLSLRIAEVNGNNTVREYVQCLLRQKKRKPIRHDP